MNAHNVWLHLCICHLIIIELMWNGPQTSRLSSLLMHCLAHRNGSSFICDIRYCRCWTSFPSVELQQCSTLLPHPSSARKCKHTLDQQACEICIYHNKSSSQLHMLCKIFIVPHSSTQPDKKIHYFSPCLEVIYSFHITEAHAKHPLIQQHAIWSSIQPVPFWLPSFPYPGQPPGTSVFHRANPDFFLGFK